MLIMLERCGVGKVKYTFNALNKIPAYAGMCEHKQQKLGEILKIAKKHQICLKRGDFTVKWRIKRFRVFE